MNKHLLAIALAAAAATAPAAHATSVALPTDGSWHEFNIDSFAALDFGTGWIDYADGSPLRFDFSVAADQVATLTVVDAGFAGDTFTVTNDGTILGSTSAVATGTTAGPTQLDFDAALAAPAWSRAVFTLGAGQYSIGGALLQSVLDNGADLDATNGAVRVSLTAVPETSSSLLMFGGLAAVALMARRRQSASSN